MKRTLFILLLIGVLFPLVELFAVPAVPWLVEKQQPDGTTIQVYLRGDEKVHWMESKDGYTLLYDKKKYVVYAQKDTDGDLIPSEIVYGKEAALAPQKKAELNRLQKELRYSEAQVETFNQIWKVTSQAEEEAQKAPVLGNKKALCILAAYSDRAFVKTKEQFENLMNQVGYSEGSARGSVKDFYRENSYGKMDLTVSVVGPVTLPNTKSYYSPDGYVSGYGGMHRWQAFARDALQAADPYVDYTEFANSSNQLETVHIIYPEYGDEAVANGQQIWAHKWDLYSPIFLDGVRCSTYSCSPELRNSWGSTLTAIGVICHELCHVFGADDYYDTNGSSGGSYNGTGNWDLMAGGSWNSSGDSPAHINMLQKILYEWVTPIELDEDAVSVIDMPNSAENPVAYVIKPYTNNEQYILENRQQVAFDRSVPGSGLLIYHVHNSASGGNINNTTHPQQVYVVCASSNYAIPSSASTYGSMNSSGAPFASSAIRNAFTTETTPAMFRWNGSTGTVSGVLDKPITNITQANKLVSFDYREGHIPDICKPAQNLSVQVVDDEAVLVWDAPANMGEEGINYTYSVYQNSVMIAENLTGLTHVASLDAYGSYEYCVYAVLVGQECTPKSICKTAVYANPNKPVVSAGAVQVGKDVLLSWSKPTAGTDMLMNYLVYMDEELIATITDGSTRYTVERPPLGLRQFTIVAGYGGEGLSDPVELKITVVEYNECIPSTLSGNVNDNRVALSWTILPNITGFNLYRNEELVLEETMDLSFEDELDASGTYTYSLVTVGEDCESAPAEYVFDLIYPCDVNEVIDLDVQITHNTAYITWDMDSEDVRKRVVYTDGFEDKLINWTLVDADGDSRNWGEIANPAYVHSGVWSAISYSFVSLGRNFLPDNWLISQAFDITSENQLSYWYYVMEGYEAETYGVYVSTTNTDITSFTSIFEETGTEAGWHQRVLDLSDYKGEKIHIAFRHFTQKNLQFIALDDVEILNPLLPKYNVYINGKLIAEEITDMSFEYPLSEEGSYVFGVTYVDYCETDPVEKMIAFVGTEDINANSRVVVSPTVTNGLLHVATDGEANIAVKDISGRTLNVYYSAGERDIILDYASGLYLIQVESNGRTSTHKVILK